MSSHLSPLSSPSSHHPEPHHHSEPLTLATITNSLSRHLSSTSSNRTLPTHSIRVYGSSAIMSPGVLYKSVVISPDTTSVEVIQKVLEKYGEDDDSHRYELRYVRMNKDGTPMKRRKSWFFKQSRDSSQFVRVLCDDECPLLVMEWFAEEDSKEIRQFELHLKPSMETSSSKNSRGSLMSLGSSRFNLFNRSKSSSPPKPVLEESHPRPQLHQIRSPSSPSLSSHNSSNLNLHLHGQHTSHPSASPHELSLGHPTLKKHNSHVWKIDPPQKDKMSFLPAHVFLGSDRGDSSDNFDTNTESSFS